MNDVGVIQKCRQILQCGINQSKKFTLSMKKYVNKPYFTLIPDKRSISSSKADGSPT